MLRLEQGGFVACLNYFKPKYIQPIKIIKLRQQKVNKTNMDYVSQIDQNNAKKSFTLFKYSLKKLFSLQ